MKLCKYCATNVSAINPRFHHCIGKSNAQVIAQFSGAFNSLQRLTGGALDETACLASFMPRVRVPLR